ncbi:MAG: hypothetical protein K6L60_08480 [Oceanobacter sp.]
MTTTPHPAGWQPLGDTSAHSDISASDTSVKDTIWYWLPGWGFDTKIFAPLYEKIPGQHFGLNYAHLLSELTEPSFQAAAEYLANNSHATAHWVGWSLGGALAASACQTSQPARLTTLATGAQFCRQSDQGHGMPAETLAAFIQGFERQPAKTLKRFTALCSQGSLSPRALSRTLTANQNHPNTDVETAQLLTTLNWLTDFDITMNPHTGLALYGDQDALAPGGLQPRHTLPGSHAFWLEDDNQSQVLAHLQRNEPA